MSSLRNAVKRVTHKERSQPTNRAHLGILEKKKDYQKRAKNYHHKQDVLRTLREKASMKNPDEFYFGMKNSALEEGRHKKLAAAEAMEREAEIGHEAVKIMKSQDLNYLRLQATKDMKRIERMQGSMHFLGAEEGKFHDGRKRKKHTVFVHNKDQAEKFNIVDYFGTVPEMAGRSFNRVRKEDLIRISEYAKDHENERSEDEERKVGLEGFKRQQERLHRKTAKIVSRSREKAYAEIEGRRKRIQQLKKAEAHLVTEKIVASKGTKRKVKGATDGMPAIYKFKRKRAK